MTVAYNEEGVNVEVDLTCLKIIGPNAMKATETKSGASALGFSGIMVLFLALVHLCYHYM